MNPCPDCGQNQPDSDHAWKRHFEHCEPHQRRIAAEEEQTIWDKLAQALRDSRE